MAKVSFRQALNDALRSEMKRDSRVVVIGEDVAGGAG
jgi:pyruvate dehydrogenase E1 component beta subunit